MLGTRHHAVLLTPRNPPRRVRGDPRRVRPERPRLHDGVARLEVEIAHRRERPTHAGRECLRRRDHPRGVCGIEIVHEPECGRRRQLGEPAKLLPRSALQVRADEESPLGLSAQRACERSDRITRPAEQNEPAHARRERRGDLGALVRKDPAARTQRRKHEPRPRHAGGGSLHNVSPLTNHDQPNAHSASDSSQNTGFHVASTVCCQNAW